MESKQAPRISVEFKMQSGKATPEKMWLADDINPLTDFGAVFESLQKFASEIAAKHTVQEVRQSIGQVFNEQPHGNQSLTCPICNAGMKLSKSGKQYVCLNAKWRKEGEEFINSGCQGSRKA